MTDEDYARKLGEVDRVLNDPDIPIQPALIWHLLAELSEHDVQVYNEKKQAIDIARSTSRSIRSR